MNKCYPCAPGSQNAQAALRGDGNAQLLELFYAAERMGLVGLGLAATGAKGKQLLHGAIAGGLAVECFVLSYAAFRNRR